MASEQANTNQAIAKAVGEATRVAIQAMAVATTERPQTVGPKIDGPKMKKPNCNWEADDKYNKLSNFRLEVNNIFRSYKMPHAKQLGIVKKWLGRKGLQFIESLTHAEKKKNATQ